MKKILSLIITFSYLLSDCPDLPTQSECDQWPQYCSWNPDSNICESNSGGDGGSGSGTGPYTYSTITEAQGLRNGPDYRDGVLYYPTNGTPPYKSIVITPGFGGNSSSMGNWGVFFASHGYTAMTIGPNDEINDSHYQRGEGLIDAIESIRQENSRISSPLNGLVDIDNFTVSGYSMGGGASHNAALMDDSIKALISLNPTVLFEDCNLCPGSTYEGITYCICLVPELIEHYIPSLIFAGEVEVNELEAYAGMLGQDIYSNLPSQTEKILFEGAGLGHGSAASPSGEVAEYVLNFLNYFVNEDDSYCESLLDVPSSASQYLTNIECVDVIAGDINNDALVNVQDIVLIVNLILTAEYQLSGDMNDDGIVNILDVVQVVNLILS